MSLPGFELTKESVCHIRSKNLQVWQGAQGTGRGDGVSSLAGVEAAAPPGSTSRESLGLYTIKDGQIVHEESFYSMDG